jgi:hypothetical protein
MEVMDAVGDTITFGKIKGNPYWKHVGHTATVANVNPLGDGTTDVYYECDCGGGWKVARGVDHSEEAPEG